MRLIQGDDEWQVTEWAWGMGAFLLLLAGGCAALHFAGGGSLDIAARPWRQGWGLATLVSAGLALLLVRQRRWCFDFAAGEVRIGEHGLFYRRYRRVPLADVRWIGVPSRPTQDEGKRLGKLMLYHRFGAESYRPWAGTADHAAVEAIALALERRLGLGRVEPQLLIQELISNGAIGDATLATSQWLDLPLKASRLKVEAQAAGQRIETGLAARLREALPRASIEQLLLFLLFLPLILLVLAFGRPKTRSKPDM